MTALNQLLAATDDPRAALLEIYPCPECRGFHVGHSSWRIIEDLGEAS